MLLACESSWKNVFLFKICMPFLSSYSFLEGTRASVIFFFYQKGKCKHCGKAISPLYPIIELFTAVGFAFCCLFINSPLEIGIGLLLVSMLAIVFVSDHTYMIIPNQVLLFFFSHYLSFTESLFQLIHGGSLY